MSCFDFFSPMHSTAGYFCKFSEVIQTSPGSAPLPLPQQRRHVRGEVGLGCRESRRLNQGGND